MKSVLMAVVFLSSGSVAYAKCESERNAMQTAMNKWQACMMAAISSCSSQSQEVGHDDVEAITACNMDSQCKSEKAAWKPTFKAYKSCMKKK